MTIRSAVSLALLMSAPPLGAAESNATLAGRVMACAAVSGDSARLACFERDVVPLARSLSPASAVTSAPAAPAPPVATQPAPAPPTAPVARPPALPSSAPSFGNDQLPASRKPVPDESEQELHGSITELRKVGTNGYLVVLDNGQQWRHSDAHRGSYLVVGEAITIRRAALGSYRLTRDAGASKEWIRVTRIR